jgi:8-oxo-dGTP pyrophosphatase MutT (NUDIX family)
VEHVFRNASRLLVLAPDERVLLLHLTPSFRDPFWVTPGGGLDDGESFEAAAERELREEVGRALPLGPCVWTRRVVFTWERWRVHQDERTFMVASPEAFEAVTVFPDEEPITGSGWFSVDQIRRSSDTIYPESLGDHLGRLLATGVPASPIDLGTVVD